MDTGMCVHGELYSRRCLCLNMILNFEHLRSVKIGLFARADRLLRVVERIERPLTNISALDNRLTTKQLIISLYGIQLFQCQTHCVLNILYTLPCHTFSQSSSTSKYRVLVVRRWHDFASGKSFKRAFRHVKIILCVFINIVFLMSNG